MNEVSSLRACNLYRDKRSNIQSGGVARNAVERPVQVTEQTAHHLVDRFVLVRLNVARSNFFEDMSYCKALTVYHGHTMGKPRSKARAAEITIQKSVRVEAILKYFHGFAALHYRCRLHVYLRDTFRQQRRIWELPVVSLSDMISASRRGSLHYRCAI